MFVTFAFVYPAVFVPDDAYESMNRQRYVLKSYGRVCVAVSTCETFFRMILLTHIHHVPGRLVFILIKKVFHLKVEQTDVEAAPVFCYSASSSLSLTVLFNSTPSGTFCDRKKLHLIVSLPKTDNSRVNIMF